MTIFNCFSLNHNSIKLQLIKFNILPFIFEIIEDSHINNINLLYKSLETLNLILKFASFGDENFKTIILDRIKMSNLSCILNKLAFSNNKNISELVITMKEKFNI